MSNFSIKAFFVVIFWGVSVITLIAGNEFKVNSYVTGNQQTPSSAMDGFGNSVIAWQSMAQDGSGWGVYAQRYDSSANPVGSEFRVNTSTTGDQISPTAAMNRNGNFVIVWVSNSDGSGYGIFAQRYDNYGNLLGGEFQVNTYTTNSQMYPNAAADTLGNFVVTWASDGQDGSGWGVYAQRYDSIGNPVNSEFQVNTYTTNSQIYPSIAIDISGDFVIAWSSDGQDGSGFGVYAQRYDNAGNTVGGEFQVNTYTTNNQIFPSAAIDNSGNFVIAWSSDGQDGSYYGVFAQRYDNSGNQDGSEFQVNTYTNDIQADASASMDSTGNFIISWGSRFQDGSNYGVYAQRYDNAGNTGGSEFLVNTYTDGYQNEPSTAMDIDGDFLISWKTLDQDGSGDGIYARLYNINPTPTPTATITSTPTITATATPTLSSTPTITATLTITTSDAYPELDNGDVVPSLGEQQSWFEYVVHYKDNDGGSPLISRIYINGSGRGMNLKSGNTWDGTYSYYIKGIELNYGTNNFYFFFRDDEGNNVRLPAVTGTISGPEIKRKETLTPVTTLTSEPSLTPTDTPTPTITLTPTPTITPTITETPFESHKSLPLWRLTTAPDGDSLYAFSNSSLNNMDLALTFYNKSNQKIQELPFTLASHELKLFYASDFINPTIPITEYDTNELFGYADIRWDSGNPGIFSAFYLENDFKGFPISPAEELTSPVKLPFWQVIPGIVDTIFYVRNTSSSIMDLSINLFGELGTLSTSFVSSIPANSMTRISLMDHVDSAAFGQGVIDFPVESEIMIFSMVENMISNSGYPIFTEEKESQTRTNILYIPFWQVNPNIGVDSFLNLNTSLFDDSTSFNLDFLSASGTLLSTNSFDVSGKKSKLVKVSDLIGSGLGSARLIWTGSSSNVFGAIYKSTNKTGYTLHVDIPLSSSPADLPFWQVNSTQKINTYLVLQNCDSAASILPSIRFYNQSGEEVGVVIPDIPANGSEIINVGNAAHDGIGTGTITWDPGLISIWTIVYNENSGAGFPVIIKN